MGRYIKKPVEIEAWHWTPLTFAEPVPNWLCEALEDGTVFVHEETHPQGMVTIKTIEGMMTAQPGDWIIRGVKNEIYPCKPDIFEATYRPAAIVAMGRDLLTPEMEEMLNKQPGAITWISDVQEVDPKTHPRGEPVDRSDVIERASKLFDMGQLVLHEAIHTLKNQLRCEGQHTRAAQAKIDELERELADARRNATN